MLLHSQAVPYRPAAGPRLLSTPGREDLGGHERRLGARPVGGEWLLDEVAQSGLRGRGGAGFPVWRKWAAVAERTSGDAVVVVNASEGEPLSAKDRSLLALRPHLVLDGALLAAETLAAEEVVVYVSRASSPLARAADRSLEEALRERRRRGGRPIRVVRTPHRYIAGESSAVVNRVSGGPARPRFGLRPTAERGVRDQPTLVQNAETLAHVAMVARLGSDWFRELGTQSSPGTGLMTVRGNVLRPGVYEVDLAAPLGEVLKAAGCGPDPAGALLGGYFGTWLPASALPTLPLDSERLRAEHGASLGCGVVAVLPAGGCPLVEAARIMRYLAAETAGQCGPCVNGLPALAERAERIANSVAEPGELTWVWRWIEMVRGRGGCHHPDGAVAQLASALAAAGDHLEEHLRGRRCPGVESGGFPAPPRPGRRWR